MRLTFKKNSFIIVFLFLFAFCDAILGGFLFTYSDAKVAIDNCAFILLTGALVFFGFSVYRTFYQSNGFQWKDALRDIVILAMASIQAYPTILTIWTTVFFVIFMCFYCVFTGAKRNYHSNVFYLLALLYLLRIIGMFWTSDPGGGETLIESNLSLLIFPLIFCFVDLKKDTINWILLWFIRSVLIFSAVSILSMLCYSQTLPLSISEWMNDPKEMSYCLLSWSGEVPVPHPSYLAIITLFAAAIAIYLFFDKTSKHALSLIELIVVQSFFFVFVSITGARVGLVLLPMLIMLAAFMYVKARLGIKIITLISVVCVGIFLLIQNSKYIQRMQDPIREQLLQLAAEAVKERPLFGHGTGAHKDIVQSQTRAEKLGYDELYCVDCVHPHNQFLTEAVQFGLILALVLPVLIFYLLARAWKWWNFPLMAFVMIETIFMLVESPLDTQKGISFFSFFATFLIAIQYTLSPEEKRKLPFTTSLIITTYNSLPSLRCVLESVKQQSALPTEVIIADDGSTKETELYVKTLADTYPVPLKHCWQEDNGFRAAAIRNKAIAASTSDYIILIDGDIFLHHHFVWDHTRAAREGLYLQGSRVLLSPNKTRKFVQENKFTVGFFDAGIRNRLNALSLPALSSLFSIKYRRFWISGSKTCNLSLWRRDALKVNGFNEDFVGWGREDSEFVARLFFAGIHRKNLRLGGIAYHIYHSENIVAEQLKLNNERLEKTLSEQKSYCENGISKYL